MFLVGKQEIHNEIAKQQTNKTSTAVNTFTTPNIYNTKTSLNITTSNYRKLSPIKTVIIMVNSTFGGLILLARDPRGIWTAETNSSNPRIHLWETWSNLK